MAAAQLKGMGKYGVTGTIKHFAGNNQEFKRHDANGVVSERALREIYLKGFEIAVKEGHATALCLPTDRSTESGQQAATTC